MLSLLDFNYRDHFSGHVAEFDSVGSHRAAQLVNLSAYSRLALSIMHLLINCLFWRFVVDRLWDSVCRIKNVVCKLHRVFNHLWYRSWDFQFMSWIKNVWVVSLANVSSRELFTHRPTCSLWWKWCSFKEDWPTFPALFSCLVLSLVHVWVQFFSWVGQY